MHLYKISEERIKRAAAALCHLAFAAVALFDRKSRMGFLK
jgi:hypothetical protein